MSQLSQFGNPPGISTSNETYEAAVTFGIAAQMKWWGGYFASTAADPSNSPTWRLRPGLVLGIIAATGQWTNYSATATDGSQVARGILAYGMRMQDALSGVNTNKFYALIIGGNVQAANLIGLDWNARFQMARNFTFDDQIQGGVGTQFLNPVTKTANYTATIADSGTIFDNTGAVGSVAITLPAIAVGGQYGIRVIADQTMSIVSAEGTNIVAFNNASASSLAFSTGGAKIGGLLILQSNPALTKWYVSNQSAGANTVTVA